MQSGVLSGNSFLDCEALSERLASNGVSSEKSARWQLAVTPKDTVGGILFRNSTPSGIIMQHAIVCGTGLLFARERRGWCTMIFVSIRFAAQDRSDHENGG